MSRVQALIAIVAVLGMAGPVAAAQAREECVVAYGSCIVRATEGAYGPAEDCLVEYYACVRRRVGG